MRIIGDVHGKISEYNKLASKVKESICVGDVGFDYSGITLDPEHHKIIGGNHDNYNNLSPHFLGHYGKHQDLFYVRGAWSKDRAVRQEYVNWFPQEEITYKQMFDAIATYVWLKPDYVITHEAPAVIKKRLCGEANDFTSNGLQTMFSIHQPDLWVFGHHHIDKSIKLNGTLFCCLNELSYLDI